jgi:hypothetical protein
MAAPQGIILIVFGIIICFAGYSLFRSMLPLWGFILGGLIAITFGSFLADRFSIDPSVLKIILFIIGGNYRSPDFSSALLCGGFSDRRSAGRPDRDRDWGIPRDIRGCALGERHRNPQRAELPAPRDLHASIRIHGDIRDHCRRFGDRFSEIYDHGLNRLYWSGCFCRRAEQLGLQHPARRPRQRDLDSHHLVCAGTSWIIYPVPHARRGLKGGAKRHGGTI